MDVVAKENCGRTGKESGALGSSLQPPRISMPSSAATSRRLPGCSTLTPTVRMCSDPGGRRCVIAGAKMYGGSTAGRDQSGQGAVYFTI
jgi:hypothetical protein